MASKTRPSEKYLTLGIFFLLGANIVAVMTGNDLIPFSHFSQILGDIINAFLALEKKGLENLPQNVIPEVYPILQYIAAYREKLIIVFESLHQQILLIEIFVHRSKRTATSRAGAHNPIH